MKISKKEKLQEMQVNAIALEESVGLRRADLSGVDFDAESLREARLIRDAMSPADLDWAGLGVSDAGKKSKR